MITLTIIQPKISGCSEDPNNMQAHPDGAYCSQCSKVVHDLSALNHQELISFIDQHPDACGSISAAALKPQIIVDTPPTPHTQFSMRFAFALLIIFGPLLFSCTQEEHQQLKEEIPQELALLIPSAITDDEFIGPQDTIRMNMLTCGCEYAQEPEFSEIPMDTPTIELQEVVISSEMNETQYTRIVGKLEYTRCFTVLTTTIDTIPSPALIEDPSAVIKAFEDLTLGVYPNPAMNNTRVDYTIQANTPLVVSIFDLSGKEVRSLVNTLNAEPGQYTHDLDVRDWPSGMYLVVLIADDEKRTFKFNVTH